MPFRKNHKFGFTSDNPLDRTPICFKTRVGVREKLLAIPGWQDKLRDYVELLIDTTENQKPSSEGRGLIP
jgi:hypothetical protein